MPLLLLKMNEMPKMLSKNFKEKNFVAPELTLNGQKEVVVMTPVAKTKKMTNVLNAENVVTSLEIVGDVVAVPTVVQVDTEDEVAAEAEVDDTDETEVDLPDEEVMNEAEVAVGAEVVAAVGAAAVLPEERATAGAAREAIVVLQAPIDVMIPNLRMIMDVKTLEILLLSEITTIPPLELGAVAGVDHPVVLSRDLKALVHQRNENDLSAKTGATISKE